MNREYITKLNKLACRLEELYALWAKNNNISFSVLMTLYALNELKICSQKEIVDGWMIPKQTLNSALKELTNLGYIKYQENINDKRYKLISFTDDGQIYANQILEGLYILEMQSLEGVDCDLYYRNFKIFVSNFEDGVKNGK